MQTDFDDTIAAISSPTGQGGIGIARMSGPDALAILRRIFRPRKKKGVFRSHHLYLGFVFDPSSGHDVDEVFAVYMASPSTYTREDVVEVYSHGGIASLRAVLKLMLANGARLAEAGEFTRRAFLNGRIDLAQAESVLDIIESESTDELRCAVSHAKGALSERIGLIRAELQGLLSETEAQIDFPDEELGIADSSQSERFASLGAALSDLVDSFYEGRAIGQGLDALIVGRANVGKSSLLNALCLNDRAIVTPLAGTTRDLLDDVVHIKGIKFRITDTAGLRQPMDPIEKEGIERVKRRIPDADICLWVLDSSEGYTGEDEAVYGQMEGKRIIPVLNKADLPGRLDTTPIAGKGLDPVRVSALAGTGLETLKERLYAAFCEGGHHGSGLLVTNVRHQNALRKTAEAIERARACSDGGGQPEFLAFELRDALACLGEITGETCSEEILDQIFSRFCIGK